MSKASSAKGEARLCTSLQLEEQEAADFLHALHAGLCSRQALVLTERAPADYRPPFACVESDEYDWLPPRCFVPLDPELRPSLLEDYARGYYYLLDLSSCWESVALSQVPSPASSLDVCGAPGGKSMLTLARYGLLPDHVCNEVHAGRRGILRENLQRAGYESLRVTGLRPDQWGKSGESFDLLLVDAPCSGQSLLAKGIKNPGCLGSSMVNGNAKRQKGILLSLLPCLKAGGYLLYTTCTYTPEENEKVMAYLLKRHPELRALDIPALARFRSRLSSFPSYRLMPTDGFGAGGFTCLLQSI